MYISMQKLTKLYKSRKFTLKSLLVKAKVSKTAYYSLLYKDTILPRSVSAIAEVLGVKPSAFLEEESQEAQKIRRLAKTADNVIEDHPGLDRENVWHTLLLLQEKPIARLNRGLLRARKLDIYS